jgi:hypothetical protein
VGFFFRLQQPQTPAKIGKCESLLSIGSSFSFARDFFPESWENPQPQKLQDAWRQRIHVPAA